MLLRELRARPTTTEGECTYIGVDTHVLAGAESKANNDRGRVSYIGVDTHVLAGTESKANNDRGRVYLHRGGHTCSCGS